MSIKGWLWTGCPCGSTARVFVMDAQAVVCETCYGYHRRPSLAVRAWRWLRGALHA